MQKVRFSVKKTQGFTNSASTQNFKLRCAKPKVVKILVVEDNIILQLALEKMLGKLGYKADFAKDGKTALASYRKDYALILMDIDIPYLNGIEVSQIIRAIEKNNRFKNVPIVAMTSHCDEPEYQEQCMLAGINEVYGKPTSEQLKALIQTYTTH